ncbi:conserved hypothetical protein [Xenorhabdus nematophila ATCC 19061]|uniref:Uncharacterized protein n=1 Tax=Xenorhabdus nematophila (strain ATCC 19061 / DSM 3370 / CCUG 14189 / LMG 1036 / NCIMB 9965 / AN6) TaxID=406817 RepID=D3VJR7_XENNA|nr:hypothetical protein [Xenorhabdus nematophila]CBJ90976.1 conserved hypothetical protein [Xenorhabdus nematophila ATCC 19061]CEE90351.1 conserved hypothetical protein [Xenorhabdus nematophila str. Anatoliense]CEE91780.1 conserved hypothetical protein [Xenorhabdus nematophila str. Anatoliense]CEK23802.1 conserved hypothetical protein [Xenorhabdus nematophila AN6/1]
MASKTHIRTIKNETEFSIVIVNGEDGNKRIEIDGFKKWQGDLVVPWIGRQGEAWKALKIYVTGGKGNVWVFQDYWNPPHKDAIKYYEGNEFSYEGAKEIRGNNQGAGDKLLLINVIEVEKNGQRAHSINLEMA